MEHHSKHCGVTEHLLLHIQVRSACFLSISFVHFIVNCCETIIVCFTLVFPGCEPSFLIIISKMDRSSSDRTSVCNQMAAVYWSTGGNFLAVPENKHISIMNIRGK